MAQQSAKRTAARQQRPQQRHKQQPVAHIGEENAPRIVVKAEHTALSVGVVGSLVNAPAVYFGNAVHRHHIVATRHTQTAFVVGRRVGAGIMVDGELREFHVKRQSTHVFVVGEEEARRFSHTQMQVAVHSPEGGAHRPDQNHDKRGMQHEGVQSMPKPSAHDHPHSRDHDRCPQQTEGHTAVDVGIGGRTSPHMLDDRGADEHHDLHREEIEREFRRDGKFHADDRLRRYIPSR